MNLEFELVHLLGRCSVMNLHFCHGFDKKVAVRVSCRESKTVEAKIGKQKPEEREDQRQTWPDRHEPGTGEQESGGGGV